MALLTKKGLLAAANRRSGNIGLPMLALCWVSFFWGTTWLASKEGVRHMPAMQLAGIRQLIGGMLYICFFLYKKAALPKGKQWIPVLILSFLNFVLSNGLSTWAVKYINSGLGSIIGAIFPLWIVIISLFAGQKVKPLAIAGMVMGFGGACVIFYDHLQDFLNADFRFGILLAVVSTISWAFGTLYIKKQAANFNPYFSIGLQMAISGLAIVGFTSATGNSVPLASIPAVSWWAIAYLVIVGSVLTFMAYIYSLQHLPISLASVYAYINPVVAVLLGALIFNEPLTMAIAVGGAITIGGVYTVNYAIRKGRGQATEDIVKTG